MNNLLLKAWFGALLSLVANFFPARLAPEKAAQSPSPIQVVQVAHPAPLPEVQAPHRTHGAHKTDLSKKSRVEPHYLCRFEGKAFLGDHPCANADIVIWISSPRIEEMRRAKTASDGSYSISFAMDGAPDEPVDWEIRGQTLDLKIVQVSGRQILMPGDQKITIENSLNF